MVNLTQLMCMNNLEIIKDDTSEINYNIDRIYIGKRVHIRCVKGAKIIISDEVKIDDDVRIIATNGATVELHDKVKIGKGSMINAGWEQVVIGQNTSTYMNVLIYTSNHIMGSKDFRSSYEHASVQIGSNCLLGSGCVIMPGSNLPDYTMVNHNDVWR